MKKKRTALYFPRGSMAKILLKMKLLTILLLSVFAVSAANDSYSQQTKFNLDLSEVSVKQVFLEIEKSSEFILLYDENTVDVNRKVNVQVVDQTVESILDQVLKGTNNSYKIYDRQIVILEDENTKVPEIEVKPSELKPQKSVKGTVTDSNGETLPGVTVVVKGTTIGTTTDMDGNYTLEVPSDDAILQFSFVGMETIELPVNGQSTVNTTLALSNIGLEEVVAVGYGTQKKSDVVSSVVSVAVDDVVKVASSDLGEMLRGKATGVQITTADASPGSSSSILIRGKRSINGGNDPLVIVDGVQVTNINEVNPNDVSNMEILKDAAAQAIYGARASNGVILITTKRGKSGETQVSYSGYFGLQTVQKHFEAYSGDEFIAYKREAFRANGGPDGDFLPDDQVFTADELATISSGDYIDWEDKVLQLAPITNHNVSITGGTEKTKVFTSIDYFSQEGIIKGTDYDRGTVRLNVDQTLTDWLKVGVNSSWQISQKENPGTSHATNEPAAAMLVRTITTSPLGQVYNEDGSLKLHPSDVQDSWNPLLDLQEITNDTKESRTIMNVFLDVTPFNGFKYRLNASRNGLNRKNYLYNSSKSLSGTLAGGVGLGSVDYIDNANWQLENILTYKPNLGDGAHALDLTFVQSYLKSTYSRFLNEATNIPSDAIGIYYLAAGVNQPSIFATERNLLSYVFRAQYNYGGKYYLSASMRADGSSVFGDNNKWGYFPAVAAGWNINNEDFLIDSETISVLKLRGSYGSVGNEGIQPYQSLNTVLPYDYIFGGSKTAGLLPGGTLPNPDLKWETTTSLNIALDYGLLKNRVTGTIEYYRTRTKDLLVNRAIEQVTGYSRKIVNLGEIENKGLEFALNGDVIRNSDFTLSLGAMFNLNRNKIISLYGEDNDGDGIEDDDIANRWFIGQPIDVYYDYKMVGIFSTAEEVAASNTPDAEPGDIQVWDRDPNDGVLNPDDRVITDQTPDWYGTFNLDMTYKGLDFSASFYTVQGVTKFNTFLVDYWTGGNPRGILNGIKQDYWTPEHTDGTRPRPLEATGRRFMDQGNVTAGLQDASFIRLQNVTIGYSLPDAVISRLGLSKVRVYCTGQNLFTITDFEAYSPENDARSYPETVSVIGGLQIGF